MEAVPTCVIAMNTERKVVAMADIKCATASPSKRYGYLSINPCEIGHRVRVWQLTHLKIRALMDKAANIRNMSVIAHGACYEVYSFASIRVLIVIFMQSTTASPHLPTHSSSALVSFRLQKLVKLDSQILVRMNKIGVLPSNLQPSLCMPTWRMKMT